MNLQFLKTWHRSFARHLEFVAEGIESLDMSADKVADDSACKLGGWLSEQRFNLAQSPEYLKLLESHRQFHKLAGEVVAAHLRSETDEIRSLLPIFLLASESVVADITQMEHSLVGDIDDAHPTSRLRGNLKLHDSIWHEDLLIGVPVIDIQHQGLAQTIDSLLLHSNEQLDSQYGVEFLESFRKLHSLHLKTEEAYLRRGNISEEEYSSHLKMHHDCSEKLASLCNCANSAKTLGSIKEGLVEILVNHIQFDKEHLRHLALVA